MRQRSGGWSGGPAGTWGTIAPPLYSCQPASAGPAQDDVLLRALRFLETLIQRDDAQKAAFLKDLAQLWPQCDGRVLRRAPRRCARDLPL